MNAEEKTIMQMRYNMCDLLESVINNLGIKNCSILHNSDYKQLWVYKDFPAKYYIATFSVDLLYINAFKGPKLFIRYIKDKLKSLSHQSNNQPHDNHD